MAKSTTIILRKMATCGLPFLCILLICATAAPGAEITAGRQDRRAFEQAVQDAFEKGDYDTLESTAQSFRENKTRLPEGLRLLPYLYIAFDSEFFLAKDQATLAAKLQAWRDKYPKSISPRLALAWAMTRDDWDSRGGSKPAAADLDFQKRRQQRITQARQILDEAAGLADKSPDWYRQMLTIAIYQNWSVDDFEALFRKAVAIDPGYDKFYQIRAEYLWRQGLPWARLTEEAARKYDPGEGLSIYTMVVIMMEDSYKPEIPNVFKGGVDWATLKQGFFDLEKQYPGSLWNLNNFCYFACVAEDKPTAQELFKQIGDKWTSNWITRANFNAWRTWAESSQLATIVVRAVLDNGRNDWVTSVAYSPDGRSLLAGYCGGAVILWDVATAKPIWTESVPDAGMAFLSVAFSPDGRLMAAGSNNTGNPNYTGTVKVWTTGSHQEYATLKDFRGSVCDVCFSPDSKTMATVGGSWSMFGELQLWDVATRTVRSHTSGIQYASMSCAFSPDGTALSLEEAQCVHAVDLATGEVGHWHLYRPRENRNAIRVIAYSPDGNVLTGGYAGGDQDRDSPGEIHFWDPHTWKDIPSKRISAITGVWSLAYSPDGRLLAAGGYDTLVHFWDTDTGKEIADFTGHDAMIRSIAFSPDGKNLASGSDDGTVILWHTPALPAASPSPAR